MKKTTYIMMAALCLLAVLAFAIPPLTLKPKEKIEKTLQRLDTTISLTTGECRVLTVTRNFGVSFVDGHEKDDDKENETVRVEVTDNAVSLLPYLEVVQKPGLTAPVFVADKAWLDNVSLTNRGDTLDINIDFHTLLAEENRRKSLTLVNILPAGRVIGRLEVPAGQPRSVSSDVGIEFHDLTDADLEVKSSFPGVTFTDCTFIKLSM